MLIADLNIGDIVMKVGDEHKYVVTSLKPIRGINGYVGLLGPYGNGEDVWINFIVGKVGHIDISYVFDELRK